MKNAEPLALKLKAKLHPAASRGERYTESVLSVSGKSEMCLLGVGPGRQSAPFPCSSRK